MSDALREILQVRFEEGIPGFDDVHDFALIEDSEYTPFLWLNALYVPYEIKFAVINPLLVREDYEPDISESLIADLEIENPEEVLVYAIATIHPETARSTVNLMGPIVINTRLKKGKQVIIENSSYTTKEPILRS